jgi:hypothetical protein
MTSDSRTSTKKKITIKALNAANREYNRKVDWKYLRKPPASAVDVPEGRVVVHNQVAPVTGFGVHGSRSWTQIPDEKIEVCPCQWALYLGKHYRVRAVEVVPQALGPPA